jgi:hypothetical protein
LQYNLKRVQREKQTASSIVKLQCTFNVLILKNFKEKTTHQPNSLDEQLGERKKVDR